LEKYHQRRQQFLLSSSAISGLGRLLYLTPPGSRQQGITYTVLIKRFGLAHRRLITDKTALHPSHHLPWAHQVILVIVAAHDGMAIVYRNNDRRRRKSRASNRRRSGVGTVRHNNGKSSKQRDAVNVTALDGVAVSVAQRNIRVLISLIF